MNELEYIKLCKKESSLILQKIICPYCGYIYDEDSSCDIGVSDDCEDAVEVKCKNCNKDIIVNSQVTQVLFWTTKAKGNNNDNK